MQDLIIRKAEIDAKDLLEYTPLCFASARDQESQDVVRLLLDNDADPNIVCGDLQFEDDGGLG